MPEQSSEGELLKRQLELTRAVWARLQAHGVTDGSKLQLDFFYEAPTNSLATQLMDFLREETDYDVRVVADEDQWKLRGRTRPAALSLGMIEQWVDWMISVGLRFGCVFDGWGAEAP